MHAVIWILGAIIILEGVVFLIRPAFFAKVISFFARGKMIYLAAVIRAVLGPIFLVYAARCKTPSVIITFGVLMLIGAVILLLVKPEKIKPILIWWTQRPRWALRTVAVVTLIIGILIAISGMPQKL
jgi:hypothetical protein